jgi:hypothetical protein
MNGFDYGQKELSQITFKKVWLAWTESKDDPIANDYRGFHVRVGMALKYASEQLKRATDDPELKQEMELQYKGDLMLDGMKFYADAVAEFIDINLPMEEGVILTMEDKLRKNHIIKDDTIVEYREPMEILENIEGLPGFRVFVLGPPKEKKYLNLGERHGEVYEQREQPSAFDFSFIDALRDDNEQLIKPFKKKHVAQNGNVVSNIYNNEDTWRKIPYNWLNGTSELALRYERNINNTSLALAFQCIESEKVLLFPGDAEFGSWLSWHEQLLWEVKKDGKKVKITIQDILANTVCYKVSHHLSQNGTPAEKGLKLMNHPDLVAFVTLDLTKIQKVWRNTMPNDHIGAGLLRQTKGKVFFVEKDTQRILDNIRTDRVSVSEANVANALSLNKKYSDDLRVEYEIAVD